MGEMRAMPIDEFLERTGQTHEANGSRDTIGGVTGGVMTVLPKDEPKDEAKAGVPCPDCGRVFATVNAIGPHRRHVHGVSGKHPGLVNGRPAPKPAVAPKPPAPKPVAERVVPDSRLCDAAEALLLLVEQAAVGGVAPESSAVNAARWRLGAAIADYREAL